MEASAEYINNARMLYHMIWLQNFRQTVSSAKSLICTWGIAHHASAHTVAPELQ